MPKKKVPKCILEKWVCCICGSDKTYIDPNGHYHWFNDYDDQRNWTGKHICNDCHFDIGKPRTKKDYSDIICCMCGGKETSKNFNDDKRTDEWLYQKRISRVHRRKLAKATFSGEQVKVV